MKVEVVTARGSGIAGPTPAESGRLPVGPPAASTAARDAPAGAAYRQVMSRGEIDAALRAQVPRQGNPMALLANLAWLASDPAGQEVPLPAAVREAALALWSAMPRREDLGHAAGLREACVRCGVGLESILATIARGEPASLLSRDWKALLLRLRATLVRAGANNSTDAVRSTSAPVPSRHATLAALPQEPATLAAVTGDGAMLDELARQANDCIARVSCNQLAGIADDPQRTVPWLLEVPVRLDDGASLLRLSFERGARPDDPASAGWRVEFAIDLGDAGALRGCVGLTDDRVEVTMHARNPTLATSLEAARGELQDALAQSGFRAARILCLHDHPLEAERTGAWLVDLRA